MAWITPKTDWSNGNRFTFDDMNRIAGNVNFLYPAANLKADWTQNDMLTLSAWNDLLDALQTLIYASGVSASVPGSDMTGDTMNEVEDLIQRINDRIELNLAQAPATIYSGMYHLYAANSGAYVGVAMNYSRGV